MSRLSRDLDLEWIRDAKRVRQRTTVSDFHPLRVSAVSQADLEKVSPGFLTEGLLMAQDKARLLLAEIRHSIQAGMTEELALRKALEISKAHGVSKHWHRPYLRFGRGTLLTYRDPVQKDYSLREGDPFYVDLGPVWSDPEHGIEYEADLGDTFVLGTNPEAERCAQTAREIFQELRSEWAAERISGEEIYRRMALKAEDRGYRAVAGVDGHRLGDFPHQKYSKVGLAQQSFVPNPALWILEVQIEAADRRFGAFFEDLL